MIKAKITIEIDITNYVEDNELTFIDAEKGIRELLESDETLGEIGFYLKAYSDSGIKIDIQ